MIGLLTDTVTVLRYTAGALDRYGNPTVTYAADASAVACMLQPATADENTTREATVVTEWRLFLPGTVNLGAHDRVRHAVEGDLEVVAEPERHRTPRGVHHVEARVRRAK